MNCVLRNVDCGLFFIAACGFATSDIVRATHSPFQFAIRNPQSTIED